MCGSDCNMLTIIFVVVGWGCLLLRLSFLTAATHDDDQDDQQEEYATANACNQCNWKSTISRAYHALVSIVVNVSSVQIILSLMATTLVKCTTVIIPISICSWIRSLFRDSWVRCRCGIAVSIVVCWSLSL